MFIVSQRNSLILRLFPTELLLGTLRTHQKAACDEEMVTLICPRGTTISIQVAQYGASASQTSCASELTEYQPVAVEVVGDSSCTWPSALQVTKNLLFLVNMLKAIRSDKILILVS